MARAFTDGLAQGGVAVKVMRSRLLFFHNSGRGYSKCGSYLLSNLEDVCACRLVLREGYVVFFASEAFFDQSSLQNLLYDVHIYGWCLNCIY